MQLVAVRGTIDMVTIRFTGTYLIGPYYSSHAHTFFDTLFVKTQIYFSSPASQVFSLIFFTFVIFNSGLYVG